MLFASSHGGEEGIGGSGELLDGGSDSGLPLVALLEEGGAGSTQGVDLVPELRGDGGRVQLDLQKGENNI